MKLSILLPLALFTFPAFAQEAKPKPVFSVAVLPFAETTATKDKGAPASELLNVRLSTSPHFVTVERTQLESVLSEQALSLSGAVSPESAAKVGTLTGAQLLVTGRIFSTGEQNTLIAKAISVSNGRVVSATESYASNGSLDQAVELLAKKLDSAVTEKAVELLPKVESAEERLERLKKKLNGKTNFTVYVHITEQNLTRPIPDPAAETEIGRTLQDLGIKLSTSATEADISITGEAFGEHAARLTGMTSCRARCEITFTRKSKPGEKLVDRVTVGAIDLSEQAASKSALQKAGSQLAEWVVDQIGRLQ